jgi:hypothetical protein
MAFTNAEKVDVRRFCGYPAYGAGGQGGGWRFFQAYGSMEYRLNNMAPEEEAVVRTVYLANLSTLETAIVGAGANLDTDVAAVWTHNRREVFDREALFSSWRARLCAFLGVPPGPDMVNGSGGQMRIVI